MIAPPHPHPLSSSRQPRPSRTSTRRGSSTGTWNPRTSCCNRERKEWVEGASWQQQSKAKPQQSRRLSLPLNPPSASPLCQPQLNYLVFFFIMWELEALCLFWKHQTNDVLQPFMFFTGWLSNYIPCSCFLSSSSLERYTWGKQGQTY